MTANTTRPNTAPPYTLAPGDLLTTPAVGYLLSASPRTVRRLIEGGYLQALRLGPGTYRVHAAHLMAFVTRYGHHCPETVAASNPGTLPAFQPEEVRLVTHRTPDGVPLVEPYRPPAGLLES